MLLPATAGAINVVVPDVAPVKGKDVIVPNFDCPTEPSAGTPTLIAWPIAMTKQLKPAAGAVVKVI